jgi:hypothetical protein
LSKHETVYPQRQPEQQQQKKIADNDRLGQNVAETALKGKARKKR